MSKLTLLPWQGIESQEIEKQIKKEVYALAKDRDTLSMCDAQLEFKFDFRMEAYVFVACMMLKYDSNLVETREILVPSLVDEDEFWRNYFYAIECIKKNLGQPTRLVGAVQESERRKLIAVQETKL
jgi:hypothetical protein